MENNQIKKEYIPKISLIIPAYNEEKYIGVCLDSIFENEKNIFYEIIVVNNQSTDKTEEVVKKYNNVKIIREERKGVTRARQRGFLESSGDILAFIDADTKIPNGWIGQIIKEFKKDKDLVCLSGPYIFIDVPLITEILVKMFWLLAIPIYWITGYMGVGGNFVIKRSTLEQMNGFDTNIDFYGDDTNTARRASAFGKVKFKMNFVMYTSARRLDGNGILKTTFIYISHFFSETIKHKTKNEHYNDIR